mmetsp:Transcript_8474/g.18301  ORF Transcript_8474/g.18301 Transcript_8474/m.18301 type:complete len:281 (+) Transcript_8474:2208-3050(+)
MLLCSGTRPKDIKLPSKLFTQISRARCCRSHSICPIITTHNSHVGHGGRPPSRILLVDIHNSHAMGFHAQPHQHLARASIPRPLGIQAPHHHHLVARSALFHQIIAQLHREAPRYVTPTKHRRRRFLHLHLLIIGMVRPVRRPRKVRREALPIRSGTHARIADPVARRGKVRIDGEAMPASLLEAPVRAHGFHHANGAGADARAADLDHGPDVGGADGREEGFAVLAPGGEVHEAGAEGAGRVPFLRVSEGLVESLGVFRCLGVDAVFGGHVGFGSLHSL